MKRLWTLLVLVALLAGLVPAALAQGPATPPALVQEQETAPIAALGTAPGGAGISNISASTVNGVTPTLLPPGTPFDLCFNITISSPDAEYLDRFDVNLPDGWTVNSLTDVPGTGCGYGHTSGVEAGNVIYWQTNGYPPPTGCGDWANGTYNFCANVTLPGCSGQPWSFPWNIIGDGYGSAPHSVAGTAGPVNCLQPGVYLLPSVLEDSGCNGVPATYQFTLMNQTGSDGTFDLAYAVPSANGTLTGPAQFTVPSGGTQDFEVVLTPDLCTDDGEAVIGQIEATGNGFTGDAIITHTVSVLPSWEAVPASAPSWAGNGYPRDGCTAMNGTGDWVTYLIGDMSGITGFWGYNHATNTWFNPGAANTPADRWAPDWAYDAATNMCYLTGGANVPGGGTYNEAYAFDPVANAFTPLGSFTSIRDFHNSWVGTIDGVKYLCIGGGVNTGGAMVQATQCYDLSQPAPGAWNAENAQMGAFPTDPFGAADGVLNAPTGDQFWYVGGAINAGANLTDEARYWDDADNLWHQAGNTGVARYRVEGDFLNGDFYQAGGSSGGFTPTSDTVRGHFDGTNWVWTVLSNANNVRMDNIVNAAGGTLWSVDGYGANAAAYVEFLAFCPECQPGGFQASKEAPALAQSGDVISYTIVIAAPALADGMYMTDTLPAGVAFAGNLTWTAGMAWYSPTANTVYWEYNVKAVGTPAASRPTVYDPAAVVDLAGSSSPPAPDSPAGPTWAYPEAILWDNGPLVTDPAACSSMDASRLQTGLGMNTLGFGDQWPLGYRMADQFTITDPGGWQIDQITFFAYQSTAPLNPSPIVGVYYQIWDGPPWAGGSIVWGDLTTNRLLNSANPNLQRDSGTAPCANNRYVFADVASAGVTLPPGTYWLDWSTEGNGAYSGPWAPPVTIVGQTTTGDAQQYTTAWAAALDTGTLTQQGLPFVIEGTIAGAGEQVTISFDVTVTAYCGAIIVNEGTAGDGTSVVNFSAATEVLGEADIEVIAPPLWAQLCPDTTDVITFTICNVGTCDLVWEISEQTRTQALASTPPRAPQSHRPVVLSTVSPEAVSVETNPPIVNAPVSLILDDGSRDNDIGIGGTLEFLWLNRFTPAPDEFPFALNQVQVYFSSAGLVNVGDDIIIVVYENTTGGYDPAPGSNWLLSYPTTVQALDAWNVYTLTTPVPLNGPGDVLVGVIALEVPGTSYWPASIDQTATQQRSWAGWWAASPPPNPPLLPPDSSWTLIDAYFPGNWMVRGYGETIEPPPVVDVPWVSESPMSGTLPAGECTVVDVTFDSTGYPPGDYLANLVIDSNDPVEPQVTLPVTMTVEQAVDLLTVTYVITDLSVAFTPDVTGTAPIDYMWAFGDGGTSTETNPIYTYAEGGCYTVTLDVANDCGTDSWTGQVCVVAPCEPVHDADFTWMPPTPIVNEVVYFTATAAGTGPITYSWDLGDGSMDSGEVVNHAYTAAGTYTVIMTATGQCGDPLVVSHDVVVASGCVAPTGAAFTWAPTSPFVGDATHFTGTVAGGTAPLFYTWDFGDGGGASGSLTPSYIYATAGTFTVTLTVTNTCGTADVSHPITVQPVVTGYFIYLPLVYKAATP
jgi:PKD repeat protein